MSEGSISRLFGPLKDGDDVAVAEIWDRYFEQLVRLARSQLASVPRRAADEEDVALSAMHSLFRGVADGRFGRLHDRSDLWKLLVTITVHKASDERKRHRAAKRGKGAVRGESVFQTPGNEAAVGWDRIAGEEPSPEMLAEVCEQHTRLLALLRDDGLRQIAQWRMDGDSVPEIAERLSRTTRTVERKLKLIRDKWAKELANDDV